MFLNIWFIKHIWPRRAWCIWYLMTDLEVACLVEGLWLKVFGVFEGLKVYLKVFCVFGI